MPCVWGSAMKCPDCDVERLPGDMGCGTADCPVLDMREEACMKTPRAHGLRFWSSLSGRDELRRYTADIFHALRLTEEELAERDADLANKSEECEHLAGIYEWALNLLEAVKPHVLETERSEHIGTYMQYFENCHLCQARWAVCTPPTHESGCLMVAPDPWAANPPHSTFSS